MANFIKVLIALSGLAFILAVIYCFTGPILGFGGAEGFSRACTNLALIAIALTLTFKEKSSES